MVPECNPTDVGLKRIKYRWNEFGVMAGVIGIAMKLESDETVENASEGVHAELERVNVSSTEQLTLTPPSAIESSLSSRAGTGSNFAM
jgi:hypothetical protein